MLEDTDLLEPARIAPLVRAPADRVADGDAEPARCVDRSALSDLLGRHWTPGSWGYPQTVTLPWRALHTALEEDRAQRRAGPEALSLEEILADPMTQLLMRSDRVSEACIRALASHQPAVAPLAEDTPGVRATIDG